VCTTNDLFNTVFKVCVFIPVVECCVKSHKDHVVIVSHDLICMIHGLVLTSHLEDELSCTISCTELLAFLTLKPQLLSLPARASVILALDEICFWGDGFPTNRPNLSAPEKLGESWFTFPGTEIFPFVLFPQLDLNLNTFF
jgi:hypothetical protein